MLIRIFAEYGALGLGAIGVIAGVAWLTARKHAHDLTATCEHGHALRSEDGSLLDHATSSAKGILIILGVVTAVASAILFLLSLPFRLIPQGGAQIEVNINHKVATLLTIFVSVLIGIVVVWMAFGLSYNTARLFVDRKTQWAAGLAASAGIALFAVWPNWITANAVSLVMLVGWFGSVTSWVRSFRGIATVAGAFMLYDVLNVFLTGSMLVVAKGLVGENGDNMHSRVPPLVFLIPSNWSLNATAAGMLGIGDIAIPGAMIVIAGLLAYRTGRWSLVYAGLAGYLVGLALATTSLVLTKAGQPALLYLYPCVLTAIVLAAWRTGTMTQLFESRRRPPKTPAAQGSAAG